jgi:hypothetical protein
VETHIVRGKSMNILFVTSFGKRVEREEALAESDLHSPLSDCIPTANHDRAFYVSMVTSSLSSD